MNEELDWCYPLIHNAVAVLCVRQLVLPFWTPRKLISLLQKKYHYLIVFTYFVGVGAAAGDINPEPTSEEMIPNIHVLVK